MASAYPTDPPITGTPSTDPPITSTPPTDPPITRTPPTDPPITRTRSTDPPITRTPPTDPPITRTRSTDPPITRTPPTDPPITRTRSTDPPITSTPPTDPPITRTPPTDPPITRTRSTDPPITRTPPTDPPITRTRSTDPPITRTPPTDPPITRTRSTDPPITSTTSAGATGCDTYRAITAAIDFGTSHSGYAFAYTDDTLGRILTNNWRMSTGTTDTTTKAPTTVLFQADKTFHSFGYDAEEKYARLCDKKQQAGWWYFRRFKMLLYRTTEKQLNLETEIPDAEGKSMPAIDIFEAVIRDLKERLLNDIRLEKEGVTDDDILFVITVPAIWSDAAKQFMREASIRAGIQNDQLRLALEPEAASVMCTKLKPCRKESGGKVTFEPFPVGHKYIVADLGGGTADIATHEVIEGGRLHDIYNALGDDLGSTRFDDEFLEFLSDLFGNNLFEEWKNNKPSDYLDLLRKIEGLKWSLSTSEDDFILHIPHTLCMRSMKATGKTFEDRLQQKEYNTVVTASTEDGTLQMKKTFAVRFFHKTVDGVNDIIRRIVTDKSISGIKTIVIVGGLSKSAYVRDCIKREFPDIKILVPEDSGLSVMKGAVLLGNRPQTIAGRIARYTYGIGGTRPFVEGKHREENKFTHDGVVHCNHVIDIIIKKGDVMTYGQRFTTTTSIRARQPETKRKTFKTYLYQSTEKEPEYITDPGCTKIGGFDEDPPEGGWPDYTKSEVEIIVGEAEFQFHQKRNTGDEYELKVNFLLPN